MKNYFIIILSIFILSACGDDDEYGIPLDITLCDGTQISMSENRQNQLKVNDAEWPTNIRSYIASELSGYLVESIISYDISTGEKQYLVTLDNQGQLLFDQNENFVCAQGDFTTQEDDEYIKVSDLPQAILDYVATNYPNATIEKAEFEDGEYEIELSTDIELCFDSNGVFLKEC